MLALVGILPLKMPGDVSSKKFMCLSGIVGKLEKINSDNALHQVWRVARRWKKKRKKKGPWSQGVHLFWEWP